MKIAETEFLGSEALKNWLGSLVNMEDSEFFFTISQIQQWDFEDLKDLAPISPLLNRVDSLLVSSISIKSYSNLSVLLDFSCLLLSSSLSKSLYNSLDELSQILDLDNWDLIFKALCLIKILTSGKATKITKDQKLTTLMHKLFVIGLGSHLNNPRPISLQDLASDIHLEAIPFQFKHEFSSDPVPESLLYVLLNRTRTNSSLINNSSRIPIVSCQLQALSLFLRLSPEPALLQEFCKTLPEIWLLPSLADFIRMPTSVEIQFSVLDLVSNILFLLESTRHDAFHSQLASLSEELFSTWNNIILSLLRDLAMPQASTLPSFSSPEMISSVLDLVSVISDCKHRSDTLNLPAITCSLLCIIKNSTEGLLCYSPIILNRAAKILCDIIPNAMEMFKEAEGMQSTIKMAVLEIKSYSNDVDLYEDKTGLKINLAARVNLIRSLLRIIKIALSKWDQFPSSSNTEIQIIMDTGLIDAISYMFAKRKYEIYEEALVIITQMINELPALVGDLLNNGAITNLLESLEENIPNSSRFVDILARFLCITAFNMDGARVIEGYNTVSKLLVVLGNTDPTLFSSNTAANISESLQELVNSVPNVIEKIIEGSLQLVNSLKFSDISVPSIFFQKVSNIGRLFGSIFAISPEIINGFMGRGGLNSLLDIFKMRVMLKSEVNEFYALTSCFKSLPSNIVAQVFNKVIQTIGLHVKNIQAITGPWNVIKDFSLLTENLIKELMFLLVEGDCYLEIIRILLQNWTGITGAYKEFIDVLMNVSILQRVLIAEQARLMCKNKVQDKETDKFDVPGDNGIIETTEGKSFEENLYFACQFTIRKVFRSAMRIPNHRGRLSINEEAGMAISKAVGNILTQNVRALVFEACSYENTYTLAMQLSDIMNILLYEQGTTPALVLQFVLQGGTEAFADFLLQLKKHSYQVCNSMNLSYHIVNSLQILWTLSGKFLESLVLGKYINSNFGLSVVRNLGYNNTKEVLVKIQLIVLECLKKINYLESGGLSTNFAKSVLEVLKYVCNLAKDTAAVDPKTVKLLVDMGFNAQVARVALTETRSTDVEMAMEWIFAHPEVLNSPPEAEPISNVSVESLHLIVINAIPAIPSLSSIIGDILIKVSLTNENINEEISLSLLTLTGKLASELLKDSNLMEVMMDMVQLNLPNIPGSFEQLGACLHIIQMLCIKNSGILEIIRDNYFSTHITNFLNNANIEQLKANWISYAFSLLDILVKSGEPGSDEMVMTVINVLRSHNSSQALVLREQDMGSLLNLLVTLTFTPSLGKFFLTEGGLQALLQCKKPLQSPTSKPLTLPWLELLKQLCEDPYILQTSYELSFLQTLNKKTTLDNFLKAFKTQAIRNKEIFLIAFTNSCQVIQKSEEILIEKKRTHSPIVAEKWETMQILAKSIGDLFNLEQKSHEILFMNSEKLISILSDIFTSYPLLIYEVLPLQLDVYDPVSGQNSKKSFIKSLVKNIFPLRYTVKVSEGKISLIDPASGALVPSSVYQNWIKTGVKLIRAMTFKQAHKQAEPSSLDIYNELMINNNKPIMKARKRFLREIKECMSEQLKTNWFNNSVSLCQIRTSTTLLMNLLREPPKTPFVSSSCVELAKALTTEPTSVLLLLTEATKGVDPVLRRAGSVYNLVLALFELLVKYHLNFILKMQKSQEAVDGAWQIYPENDFVEDSNSEAAEVQNEESSPSSENAPIDEDL